MNKSNLQGVGGSVQSGILPFVKRGVIMNYILKKLLLGPVLLFWGCMVIPATGGDAGNSRIVEPSLSAIEKGIVRESNLARTNPAAYASKLEKFLSYYKGNLLYLPGKIPIRTKEGPSAAREAIRFLKRQKPVGALIPSRGMSLAARDHVRDTGPKGKTGHYGTDGSNPFDRMRRYGKILVTAGENIGYGLDKPEWMVIQLIIDDGVRGRGHRTNLFKKKFRYIGVAYGKHRGYRTMNVSVYAGGFIDKK